MAPAMSESDAMMKVSTCSMSLVTRRSISPVWRRLGNEHRGEECDLPGPVEEEDDRAEEDEDGARDVGERCDDEGLHLLDVARHPAQHLARLAPAVEREGEALEVRVERHPDAVSESASRPGQEDLRQRVAQAAERGEQDETAREDGDRADLRRDVPREPDRGTLAVQVIDHVSDRVGLEHPRDGLADEHDEGDDEHAPLPGAESIQHREDATLHGGLLHRGRHRQLQIGAGHGAPPSFTPRSTAISSAVLRSSNRSSTAARPAEPNRARSAASSSRRPMFAAIPAMSCGSTISPDTPGVTSSGIPPAAVVTTGRPLAIASMITFGMPSRSPSSSTHGARAKRSASRYAARISRRGRAPVSVTWPSSRRTSIIFSSRARSGPSP